MLYQNEIRNWCEQFKSNIKSKRTSETLYIVNEELLYSKNKFEKYNSKILNNHNELEEEKDFIIIDKTIWSRIKNDFPNEKEIKIDGRYENKKCIFLINNYVYYFYYVNENNHLIEGYFRFQLPNEASKIFAKFIGSDFNDFINEYNINKNSNSKQTIDKNNIKFFFQIKPGNKNKNDINSNHRFNNFGNFEINISYINNIYIQIKKIMQI